MITKIAIELFGKKIIEKKPHVHIMDEGAKPIVNSRDIDKAIKKGTGLKKALLDKKLLPIAAIAALSSGLGAYVGSSKNRQSYNGGISGY